MSSGLTPFGNAVSGSLGALFANTTVFPLDVIKTRIQVQTRLSLSDPQNYYDGVVDAFIKILKYEGIAGLYSGLGAGLAGTVIQNFAYFYAYGMIRGGYAKRVQGNISTGMELLLGALAGATTQFFTLPIAVITTRQQTTPTSEQLDFMSTLSQIVREEGAPGLWKGLRASLVLCINPAITYGMFERIKRGLLDRKAAAHPSKSVGLTSMEAFLVGALNPYIMAKVRLQWKPSKSLQGHLSATELESIRYKSAVDVLKRVLKTEGLSGWYKGMHTQITKAVLCQAILFVSKERASSGW